MTFKARLVYVVMRDLLEEGTGPHPTVDTIPVGIFTDLETAEGNAEGYNLQMQEDKIEGLHFHVKATMFYE